MDFYTNMGSLLEGLGKRIGLDLTAPDLSDDYFGLAVDKSGVLNILLQPHRRTCVLHREFSRDAAWLSTDDMTELVHHLTFLLGANVMLLGAGGAALGYDETSGTLSLSMSYNVPENVQAGDREAFADTVEAFLESFARWSNHMKQSSDTEKNMTSMIRV